MAPIEVVIDGTNFGGKTPLVTRLIERINERGLSVTTASPYREIEVYALWDDAPWQAAQAICERMAAHREQSREADVIVWDRGWPTCFVSTRDPAARRLFLPLPPLTFVLLNTAETTDRKVQKYGISPEQYPWMHRHRLRDETSYRELARRFADDLRTFEPTLADSRFDLDLVSSEIVAEILPGGRLPEPASGEEPPP